MFCLGVGLNLLGLEELTPSPFSSMPASAELIPASWSLVN